MARRKITEPADLADLADELPELTAQQTAFVRGLLDGQTATDAYRAAYDCTSMKAETVWEAASRLRHDSKVAARLNAARKAELGHCRITLDQHVRRLDRLCVIAEETGNIGAAVQAEQIIGKVLGHHVERFEDVTTMDPVETLKQLALLVGEDAARAIAIKNNVPHLVEHKAEETQPIS